MILPDVNVLVYAHHEQSDEHERYRKWWESAVNGPASFGMAPIVLSGFVRVVTHPKVFDRPLSAAAALDAAAAMRSRPNCVLILPGDRHWSIFDQLCRKTRARGNQVPDAFLAALVIESGSELATADRGFAKFPGLRWFDPHD
jgi:toxin-antitoxin system PIN domain toxin